MVGLSYPAIVLVARVGAWAVTLLKREDGGQR